MKKKERNLVFRFGGKILLQSRFGFNLETKFCYSLGLDFPNHICTFKFELCAKKKCRDKKKTKEAKTKPTKTENYTFWNFVLGATSSFPSHDT